MNDPVKMVHEVLNEPLFSRADVAAMLCLAKEAYEALYGEYEGLDVFIMMLPNYLIKFDPVDVRPLDNQLS